MDRINAKEASAEIQMILRHITAYESHGLVNHPASLLFWLKDQEIDPMLPIS